MNRIQNIGEDLLGGQLRKIGNYLGLRPEIDKNLNVTSLIRSNLSVVDIIPVDFGLQYNFIWDKNSPHGFAISYDFDTPTGNYRARCAEYALDAKYDGVQLWLTDDTQAYEEMSNTFANNVIETGVNQAAINLGEKYKSFTQSMGIHSTMNDRFIPDGAGNLTSGIAGFFGASDSTQEAIKNITGTVADVVIRGKQLSLPKIWRQSDYNPSVTFNVKLVSPYGSPQAVKEFIIAPLIYILLLSSPESGDGLTYGLYQPVKIKAYGISNINLGAITSVSLRRGGRESAYNAYKQPLQLDVGINVIPLSSGFAHMTGVKDVATMSVADLPYAENAAGSPAVTTVGNVIQSLRPAPQEVVNANASNVISSNFEASSTASQFFSQSGVGGYNKNTRSYDQDLAARLSATGRAAGINTPHG